MMQQVWFHFGFSLSKHLLLILGLRSPLSACYYSVLCPDIQSMFFFFFFFFLLIFSLTITMQLFMLIMYFREYSGYLMCDIWC